MRISAAAFPSGATRGTSLRRTSCTQDGPRRAGVGRTSGYKRCPAAGRPFTRRGASTPTAPAPAQRGSSTTGCHRNTSACRLKVSDGGVSRWCACAALYEAAPASVTAPTTPRCGRGCKGVGASDATLAPSPLSRSHPRIGSSSTTSCRAGGATLIGAAASGTRAACPRKRGGNHVPSIRSSVGGEARVCSPMSCEQSPRRGLGHCDNLHL